MKKAVPYDFDNEFRACARRHQSDFRENTLGIDFDDSDDKAKYGNLLPKEIAKQGLIFYEGYRDYIIKVAMSRYGKNLDTARYANLLRSEHIPLNIFTPMELNTDKAKELFSEIISEKIASIQAITIEYPGKYDPLKYLKDRTSFDTFITYTTNAGLKGGIGIEVKYTEEGYKIGPKENDEISTSNHPYTTVTKACGYFINPNPKKFIDDSLRQIWRNHILGASMVIEGDFEIFHCIHLYPQRNTHFQDYAIPQYIEMLTQKGKDSFIGLTYEDLFYLMAKYFNTTQELNWIEYLNKRYLF
jgi:hypothetical protein